MSDLGALWEKRFLAALKGLAVLLRQHNVEQWANWFEEDLSDYLAAHGPPRQIARQQAVVEHVLTAFGGMSAFKQLVLTDAAGQPLAETNERLLALSTQLWATARSVQGFLVSAQEE
jgi:Domain of unknown function (DUF6966)